jgi:hypothetical protein
MRNFSMWVNLVLWSNLVEQFQATVTCDELGKVQHIAIKADNGNMVTKQESAFSKAEWRRITNTIARIA